MSFYLISTAIIVLKIWKKGTGGCSHWGGMAELALLIGVLLFVEAIGCPSCFLARSQQRELSLRQIKEQILESLGLQQAPNITGRHRPNIPPLEGLYDQFQFQADQAQEEEEAELTVDKVIAFGQPHPKMRHLKGKELLNFKFSEKMLENRVVNAYLWLFLRGSPREDAPPVEISVFKVASDDETPTLTEINTVKEARTWGSKGNWVKIDVKPLVSEWFKMPNEPMSLAVQASIKEQGKEETSSSLTQRLVVVSTRNEASSFMPFLELKVSTTKKKRIKRTTGLICQENSEETRCCRHPLTVDFESFGWDWIIAPKTYEAYYCSGECPNVYFQNYPHTHLMQMASPSSTAGRCCAPRKMSSITMLYFDKDLNVIFGLLPGMVVDRCGCS